jgi:hypothetical protein
VPSGFGLQIDEVQDETPAAAVAFIPIDEERNSERVTTDTDINLFMRLL